jgi:D-glycero-D-manno-heptose 1,7-bisphosphate phosphatase
MSKPARGYKAVFLDRDGVINRDDGYVYQWAQFRWMAGAIEALKALQSLDYRLIVVSNQSGIGRGFYSEDDVLLLHEQMRAHLSDRGVMLLDSYICPHHPSEALETYRVACHCRKPKPGMILSAVRDHHISIENSVMVGDKPSDMEAGLAAGIPIRLQVGEGEKSPVASEYLMDLAAVAEYLSAPSQNS